MKAQSPRKVPAPLQMSMLKYGSETKQSVHSPSFRISRAKSFHKADRSEVSASKFSRQETHTFRIKPMGTVDAEVSREEAEKYLFPNRMKHAFNLGQNEGGDARAKLSEMLAKGSLKHIWDEDDK